MIGSSDRMSQQVKQWRCPSCDVPLPVDRLIEYTMGGKLGPGQVGGWYVRGQCPDCMRLVQFTKHGAGVLREPGKPGYAATVFVKHVPGRYME